jgi:hypothetical protein
MLNMDDILEMEYCELKLRALERERQRILSKRNLSEYEDRRLDEIDEEVDLWENILCEIERPKNETQ